MIAADGGSGPFRSDRRRAGIPAQYSGGAMKKLVNILQAPGRHWVGDGFPVRSVFTYQDAGSRLSPFLLLDHAGPHTFAPGTTPRGVGEHPHRGFETVTIVYDGEVDHRDSSGGGGRIRPGDVQWMTAAGGLVHEEKHSADFTRSGGRFHMVQLWVNLPARDKMAPPRYQGLTSGRIPSVPVADGNGTLRIIAGTYAGVDGPARTFSPIDLWDIRLAKGARHEFAAPAGHTAAVMVVAGHVRLHGGEILGESQLGVLERAGDRFTLEAIDDARVLFLGGEPLDEPVVGYGPFVMNTADEIEQAIVDYQSGRMGQLVRVADPG
jgi:redox-sensitive bicupin YhaK (pirin superfamily)